MDLNKVNNNQETIKVDADESHETTPIAVSHNKGQKKSSHNIFSKLKNLINAPIAILFLGSFVFASLVENYKDDLSFRRSIVSDIYRPMIQTQISCKDNQNILVLKVRSSSEIVKQMLNEIDIINSAYPKEISSGKKLFLESLLKGMESSNMEIEKLRKEQNGCQQKLMRFYEEISLLTGTYERFKYLTKNLSNKLIGINTKGRKIVESNINYNDIQQLIEKIGDISEEYNDELDSESLNAFQHVMPGLRRISNLMEEGSSLEGERRKLETQYHEELHEVFANEINHRFKEGFISKLLRII
jgi:hypothetical protein